MALLEVKDLHTSFFTDAGEVRAVNGVSFTLDRGRVLGIVGESGSGKSVTAYSIMQILASTGKIVSGSIKFDGEELVGAGEKVMKNIRGNKISIIFQDPMTSLNPTYTIGKQLMEAILLHTDRNKKEAYARAVDMLRLVNVNEPEKRMFPLRRTPYCPMTLRFWHWVSIKPCKSAFGFDGTPHTDGKEIHGEKTTKHSQ